LAGSDVRGLEGSHGARRVAVIVVAIALAAACVPAAQAEQEVNGFIGGAPGTTGGHFLEPTDVDVLHGDPSLGTGKILVVEGLAGNSRVQRLDDDGNFELAWGKDVVRAGAAGDSGTGYEVCERAEACKAGTLGDEPGELAVPSGVAVNQPTGAVYVLDGGNGRVQQFTLGGRFVRAWTLAVPGSRGRFEHAPIAVSPLAPHDVFVGDDTANRVLQFSSEGEFVRAWGWGVDTGSTEFETCTADSGCQAGRRAPGLEQRRRTWPRHLAVDAEGVVYSSPYLGLLFDSGDVRAKIFRFRSDSPPDPPSAADSELRPLETNDAAFGSAATAYLTDGATLGLDVDPASGHLLAINNPFGTSRMDEVRNLSADGDERPRVEVIEGLPFLQNVTGITASDGVALISSGKVEQLTGTSSFTGCADDDARRDCHGLIAITAGGPPRAVVEPGVIGWALVDPGGVATYRFEASRDGRTWRRLGRPRHVAGNQLESVPAPPGDLDDGVYKIRLVATKRTEQGVETTTSPEGVLVVPDGAGPPVRTADPVSTFAPAVSLHERERFFPVSARHFVDWSTLKWEQEDCPPSTLAVGEPRHRAGLDDSSLPVTDAARLGGGASVYRFRPPRADCPSAAKQSFATDEHTRPSDPGRPGGLTGATGFYLDLATDELDGQRKVRTTRGQAVLGGIPAYFERLPSRVDGRPAERIVYWLLFGHTGPSGDDDYVRSHEGGWERVSVLVHRIGRNRYVPESVRYHAWGERRDVPWADVMRVDSSGRVRLGGTHPVVLSARGSHALYPGSGDYVHRVRADGRRFEFVDRAERCRRCPQWRTWKRLLPLRRQPWYGFGGAWGRVFGDTHTTGPLGPSPYRASD
jgi:hypothetical protein